MRKCTEAILIDLYKRYPDLLSCKLDIDKSVEALIDCFKSSKKLLVCGNGGSAADSEHIVGELMKGFLLERKIDKQICEQLVEHAGTDAQYLIDNLQMGLPAISLVSQSALISAFSNDNAADLTFSQQVLNYGNEGDVLIAISTSGNSKNVIYATQVAKAKGVFTIALTGKNGGKLKEYANCTIKAPSDTTFIIQEYHLPIYHALCAAVETEFFNEEGF